eukprot:TRINITY_DN175_c0_g1_i18.p1 TRINITY_DN175_c0_g1~~TRINITY_DN175_c0_g1_i18.p1  ORF type:complete len:112 (-),score=25.24 TRINITY_DN175_c0_g1_i18:76-411(-)
MLSAMLERMGFETKLSLNGEEAITAYRDSNGGFSAIFMDCLMPCMNGIEATKNLRLFETENELPHVPVIGISALQVTRLEDECLAAGMDYCLTKPVKSDELAHIITKYVKC